MANPELELQGAIVARLKADAAVTAIVAGRIYDSVPANAPFPYVSIGPVDTVDDTVDCIAGLDVAQQIDCWSRYPNGGSVEVKKLADAVRVALHGREADMPLASNALAFFEHRTSRITRDPDGLTSHGIIGFEAAIERR